MERTIDQLLDIRVIDMTGREVLELIQSATPVTQSEWVTKEERNQLFGGISDATYSARKTWGEDNGYKVQKSGGGLYNRADLMRLIQAFAENKKSS